MEHMDLSEMFKKKNIELFQNKLTLDVENNLHSLLLSIENILDFEFERLEREMKKDHITNVVQDIQKEKNYIYENVVSFVEQRKEQLVSFLKSMNMEDGCILKYQESVEQTGEELQRLIEDLFSNQLNKKHEHQKLWQKCYVFIESRTKDQIMYRGLSLKNIVDAGELRFQQMQMNSDQLSKKEQ